MAALNVAGWETMSRFLPNVLASLIWGPILGCAATAQAVPVQAVVDSPTVTPTGTAPAALENAETTLDPASLLPDLPALPRMKASLIGGTVKKVDRVRDQLTVQVFGGGKMRILFDPRTHIYEGSAKAAAPDIHPGDRIYVDTILDGDTIFARNIRLATTAAAGKSQGVVVRYSPEKEELSVRDLLSPEPVKIRLSSATRVLHEGRTASASELMPGTLVDVEFASQKNGRDARQISILAVPGAHFTFGGTVTSLDLSTGLLVLKSSTDHKTYEIYLDPAYISVDDRLHPGADVTAETNFDGSRYTARSITVTSR
jgi:hypothetical protein